ncbi:unnamed protein product [Thelazia callipaeda]|uniref:Amiloride-sensitive sodium channel n=1 Tax=Thelazia callipaeda TaxID=103827 RepID=A0A0N5DA64_THECL|nr:unnamed protein product [Thelazia callipaeda]
MNQTLRNQHRSKSEDLKCNCLTSESILIEHQNSDYDSCWQQTLSTKLRCITTSMMESKTAQTEATHSLQTTPLTTLNTPRRPRHNLLKQVSFDFDPLKKNTTLTCQSPLLTVDSENCKKDENRHLSDIQLLRQVYDELRQKISQRTLNFLNYFANSSHDQMVMNTMKITKGISWKECFLGERMRRWGFWFIVTFLAAMTIRDVILLVIEYMEYPKQSDMNIMFNESMYMPNITFCMSKQQAWSHFTLNGSGSASEWDEKIQEELRKLNSREKFLGDSWDYRLIVEAYEVIATLNSMERETTAQGSARSINFFRTHPRLETKRTMVKTWLNEIKQRDISFEELTQKVGFETIKHSIQRFQRTTFDESLKIKTRFRTSWISTMEFCFQPWFDTNNYYEIRDQGNFFTMLLSHNVDNLEGIDIDCMSVDFHGRPSSLSRFMEGQGRARDGFNDDICLGIRHEVTVEVRARYVMLENDENGTSCRNAEKKGEGLFDCRSRCRMEMIRDMCNCTPPTLSYLVVNTNEYEKYPICDYEKCEINISNRTYSDQKCTRKCHRFCDQITYDVSHVQHGKMFRQNLTVINLNWGSFEYLTLRQYWVWSMPTFIAALGGSMGAWLGLSILSLIQGGTYLYAFLTTTIKKKHLLQKNMHRSRTTTSYNEEVLC